MVVLAPTLSSFLRSSSRLNLKDVRDGHRAGAADALRHAGAGAFHLRRARLAAELLRHLDDLVRAARPDRMAAALQPAQGADRQIATLRQPALRRQLQGVPAVREPARLERERR